MSEWKFKLAGVLGQGLVGSLFTTTRAKPIDAHNYLRFREKRQPVLFVLWHGQLLPLVHYHQQEKITVLVSEHADGEYITRVLHRYGFDTARGSSTRGGSKGLKGLVRAVREGRDIGITPDGPRGPARVCKPGALVAAQITGVPIIPMAVGSDSAWSFQSWDRFSVPKPLTRLRIIYGEPVYVPREMPEGELEAMAARIGNTLNQLTARAEKLASNPKSEE